MEEGSAGGDDEEEEEGGGWEMQGQWTVDGKYYFATLKELKMAWKDADLVHRADL